MNIIETSSGNSLLSSKMSSRKAARKPSVFDRLGPSDYDTEKEKPYKKKAKEKDRPYSSKDDRRGGGVVSGNRHTHQNIDSPPNSDFEIKRNWSKGSRGSRVDEDRGGKGQRSSYSPQSRLSPTRRKVMNNGKEPGKEPGCQRVKYSQPQDTGLQSVVAKQPANPSRTQDSNGSPVRSRKRRPKEDLDVSEGDGVQPVVSQVTDNGDLGTNSSVVDEQPTRKPSNKKLKISDNSHFKETSHERNKLLGDIKGCRNNHLKPACVFADIGCCSELAGPGLYREVLDTIKEQYTLDSDSYKPSLALARELKHKKQLLEVFKLKSGAFTSVDDRRLRKKLASYATKATNTDFKGLKFSKDLYSKSVQLLKQSSSSLDLSTSTLAKRISPKTD